MPTELATHLGDAEAFHPGTIPGLAQKLYELRGQINDLQGQERNLTTILKDYCEKTGEVIQVEGQPDLRVVRTRNDEIDVSAIAEKAPHLFRQLIERHILSVSKTRLNANKDLTGFGPFTMPGETVSLRFDRKR